MPTVFFNNTSMRSLNKVMLIGHLASDVELRQTKNGMEVANFSLATNRFVRDESGEKREVADFHKVIAWNHLARISSEYLKKGMAVFVEGRIINRSFDDKNGVRHFRTEVIADNVNILTWKNSKSEKSDKTELDLANVTSSDEEIAEAVGETA